MKYRKCPKCKKQNFRQNQVYDKIQYSINGKLETTMRLADGCHLFKCYDCGYHESRGKEIKQIMSK